MAAIFLLFTAQRGSASPGADKSQNESVSGSLVADVNSIVPGVPFRIGVKLEIDSGWYLNWGNPGDAGLAPSIEWQLPSGFKPGVTMWPHPGRFPVGPMTVFGYRSRVLLWTRVTPPSDLTRGSEVSLAAGVSWLACGDGFVPGGAELALTIPVAASTSASDDAPLFDEAETLLPAPPRLWQVYGWYQDDHTIVVELQGSGTVELEDVFLYPYDPGVIDPSLPQALTRLEVGDDRGSYRLLIPRDPVTPAAPSLLRAVIVSRSGWGEAGPAIDVEIQMGARPR